MKLFNLWLPAVVVILLLFAAPAAPAQSNSPQASSASAEQINEICERYDVLAHRITSARAGLKSIKRQMAAQGLQLRSDILGAEARMQDRRDHAREAITRYDLESATEDLQIAEAAAESIERFLGR